MRTGEHTMRYRLLLLLMLLCVATAAPAQVNIGINFSLFPELVRVPNYPVYYAPRQNANYFFTMACTGSIRMTSGTRATGTTGRGGVWILNMYRFSCCGFPCAITGVLPHIFAGGDGMRRHVGANTGAA